MHTVELKQFMQLLQRSLLRFPEHRFIHGRAVVLMPDDNPSFPSSVRAFAYHSVALRSSSVWHFIFSFVLFLQPQHTTRSRIYPAFCGAILIENRRKFLNFALFPSQHRNNPRKHRHFRYLQHQRSFFVRFTAPS